MAALFEVTPERMRVLINELRTRDAGVPEKNCKYVKAKKKSDAVGWLGRAGGKRTVNEILDGSGVNKDPTLPKLSAAELEDYLERLVRSANGVTKLVTGGEARYECSDDALASKKSDAIDWLGRADRFCTLVEILEGSGVNEDPALPKLSAPELEVHLEGMVDSGSGITKLIFAHETRYKCADCVWAPGCDRTHLAHLPAILEHHLKGTPVQEEGDFSTIHQSEGAFTFAKRFEMVRAKDERVLVYYAGPTAEHAKSMLKHLRATLRDVEGEDPKPGD
jgi:hypothetical protein